MQVRVDVSQIGAEMLRLQKLRDEVEERIRYFEELLKQYDAIGDQNRMLTDKLAKEKSSLNKFRCKLDGMKVLSGEKNEQISKCIEKIEKSINSLDKQLRDGKAKQGDVYKKMLEVTEMLDQNQFELEELVRQMKEAAEDLRIQKDIKTRAIQGVLSDPKTSGKRWECMQGQLAYIGIITDIYNLSTQYIRQCALCYSIYGNLFDRTKCVS